MKNKDKINVAKQLKEFEKLEQKFKEDAKSEVLHTDESYEIYRDAYRFMTKVFFACIAFSLILNLASSVILSVKEPGKAYTTSRDGKVQEIYPIARR